VLLPGNAIGISDILQYRDCGSRWEFDMQRWSEQGELPGATNPNNAYGSAMHHAIALTEEGLSDEEAIDGAVAAYGSWLEPEDVEALAEDLTKYHERDYAGVRTVASEENMKVPLFVHNGETIYYRFTLDRLYVRLNNPTSFLHIDYKSSKHNKSEVEVHKDPQLWSYNWAIHEMWPECEDLAQIYDQFNFGSVPTRKNAAQREEIKRWLIAQVKAILEAEEVKPRFHQWCPWCPLMESCSEPKRAAEFARTRIAELSPEGQDIATLASADMETYLKDMYQFETVRKCIERFEESVKGVLRELPAERRQQLGWGLFPSSRDTWGPSALRQVYNVVGDDFFLLVKLTKTNISRFFGKDKAAAEQVMQFAEKERAAPRLSRLKP
jgi:hypothetical protein